MYKFLTVGFGKKWSAWQFRLPLVAAVCAMAFIAGLAVYEAGRDDDANAVAEIDMLARGSLTFCIENDVVANEIEISESSIKRATLKVSGLSSMLSNESNDGDYCAMSLV